MTYKIIMDKNDFFKIHNRIAAKNLEIKEEKVRFEVELGSLSVLKESGYPYHLVDSFRIKLQFFIKQYYLVLIGVLFLFTILYINSYRVNTIRFNITTPINQSIEARIRQSFKRLFCFNFSNLNYTAFSKELRLEYVEYPYIEVYSKNNDILVEIYSYDDKYPDKSDNFSAGDIVAKKDGIVDSFYVYSGNSLISKNKYVKKGDVLISGSINNNSVTSKGMVMAYTYEKVSLEIAKREETEAETDSRQSYYRLCFFNQGFSVNKKTSYGLFNSTEKNVFNLFDIFYVKKIEETEKNVIIKENDEDKAIEQAEQTVRANFEQNKVSDAEKIVELMTYDVNEGENSFTITFIMKKLESIGEFQAF